MLDGYPRWYRYDDNWKARSMALADNPFEWSITKAGKLMIFRGGKQVMIVSAAKAEAIIAKLGVDDETDQQVMARVTGQYRMGNEREAGSKNR